MCKCVDYFGPLGLPLGIPTFFVLKTAVYHLCRLGENSVRLIRCDRKHCFTPTDAGLEKPLWPPLLSLCCVCCECIYPLPGLFLRFWTIIESLWLQGWLWEEAAMNILKVEGGPCAQCWKQHTGGIMCGWCAPGDCVQRMAGDDV